MLRSTIDYTDINEIICKSWVSILRIIVLSQRFNFLINDYTKETAIKLNNIGRFSFSYLLSFKEKIELLQFLVNSAFDTELIKFEIKQDFHKLGANIREKPQLELNK